MHKKHRLRANADFQHVRREGRTSVHPLLVISVLPNGLEQSRFGFAVSRQVGKAVQRNRVRRRMRESIRMRVQRNEVAAGWDVVLIARTPIRDASFQEVDAAIGLLLRRAGLGDGHPAQLSTPEIGGADGNQAPGVLRSDRCEVA
jgi:ribonuclease P protein component